MDRNRLALVQGAYYFGTGVWPLVHLPSFEAVTGPKKDHWLVRTVGALVGVMGATFIQAARRHRTTPEISWLAASSAASLAAIEIWYVARRRISPIYLADAILEGGLIGAWLALPATRKRPLWGEFLVDDLTLAP